MKELSRGTKTRKIIMMDDLKTDLDVNIYGWEMRLIQIEEEIAILNKRKEEIVNILKGQKEDKEKECVENG